MNIVIPIYDRFTALDAIGPYEVLARVPGATLTFASASPGGESGDVVRTDTGRLGVTADAAITDIDPSGVDVVVVPGGPGQAACMDDGPFHEWLRDVDEHSTWTASVCTGSLILAAAGLLKDRRATTHWLYTDGLPPYGADIEAGERWVVDGKYVTAAGVSAGIDMALWLAAQLSGETVAQTIQLGIEYDPHPPFAAGSPDTAPPEVVAFLREHGRALTEPVETSGRLSR